MIPGRLIDAHHHLWDLDRNRYPWLQDGPPVEQDTSSLAPIRKNYLPVDYFRDTAAVEIVGSVHVEAASDPENPVTETDWVAAAADDTGTPSAIVAFARLERHDRDETLEAHVRRTTLLRGVRQMLNWEPEERVAERKGILDDPLWQEGLRALAARHLSFDLQVFPSQLIKATEVLSAHPELHVVLDHGGFTQLGTPERWKSWDAGIRELAALPHVCVKVSSYLSVDPNIDDARWHDGMQRFVDTLAETFGPQRMMFGSNLPVDGRFASFEHTVGALCHATRDWPAQDREALFVTTAADFYRISPNHTAN